tara:strand:- start:357 stop:512 length:156 start_codon:yes stop_codon:yes gene_type:complete
MDKEKLMTDLWLEYKKSSDIRYLIEACNNAPFFGNPEMGKEIAKKLAENIK